VATSYSRYRCSGRTASLAVLAINAPQAVSSPWRCGLLPVAALCGGVPGDPVGGNWRTLVGGRQFPPAPTHRA
jgi:hypothetical protein